jgi:hypothetical protein
VIAVLGVVGVVGVMGVLSGCGIWSKGGSPRLQSLESGAVLTADLNKRVYVSQDTESADFYMTDLPESVWNGGADVSDMAGMIVHVHMFLRPKAGHTPIEDTASTSVIRCVVLAKGEIGVYGGGGFFVNSGAPGGKSYGGSVRNGTLHLVSATAGFKDRLGPCSFVGSVSGKRDAETCAAMARAINALVAETSPTPTGPAKPGE